MSQRQLRSRGKVSGVGLADPANLRPNTATESEKEPQRVANGSFVTRSWAAAVAQAYTSQWVTAVALIFGGCCSNVFTLEAIVREAPNAGHLITFTQFLFVSAEGFVHFFDPGSRMFLRKPQIPLVRWIVPVTLFFAISVLNNYVWSFHISVPVHIIFRSGGTLITMILGMMRGVRYKAGQVLGVVVLTAGVTFATLASRPKVSADESSEQDPAKYALGIAILAFASILAGVQGLVTESVYAKYGRHWRETLFYTHFLALPLFLPMRQQILDEWHLAVAATPAVNSPVGPVSTRLVHLALNAMTQYMCVRGVNHLAGQVTALTVTIILNIRKFTSLLLSVYLFGNSLSPGMLLGSALVFAGAVFYSRS